MFVGNDQETSSEFAWQDLLATVFRHKRIIIRIGIAGLVLASVSAWIPRRKRQTR